jgi:uncharacterized membrane protein YtjA (UPF0391 family)
MAKEIAMTYYIAAFLIVAGLVGIVGGLATTIAWAAKVLFCIFLIAVIIPVVAERLIPFVAERRSQGKYV